MLTPDHRPLLLALFLTLLGTLSGCQTPCEAWVVDYCNQCGSNVADYVCTCADKERLAEGDYPEGTFPSEEDATSACQEFLLVQSLADSDAEASCRASGEILGLYGSNACEDLAGPGF